MRIGYFDCFSGASGDMILGALIDAGLSQRKMKDELEKLQIPTVRLKIKKVNKAGIQATRVIVEGKNEKRHHRNLNEILEIVEQSSIDPEVKEKSKEIFKRIAEAEAKIHRRPIEEIHFHEIGGLDSVVDIVCSVWGIRQLGLDEIYVSRVNVGSGFVKCEHGILPVPAPATLLLMKEKPIYSTGVEKELLTPTGAAILTSLGSQFGPIPEMKVESVGYGAGRDDLPHPNVLRLIIGRSLSTSLREKIMVIETNIDDMNPQFYDYIIERLFTIGARDVFLTPIIMKKNRPATLISIISSAEKLNPIIEFLLKETTTIGIRWHEDYRICAQREIITIRTKYGNLRFKVAKWDGKPINISPEYEDCKNLAFKKGISIKEVFDEAKRVSLFAHKGMKTK
jgi:uncharacterized protein (TIGR00299 family) protein